ncbi:MAG TPA: hypothetical protein VML75_26910 [Kofleriaceae bacterium]|nr:hypothetical protein [Kofleriaceae bacterium]
MEIVTLLAVVGIVGVGVAVVAVRSNRRRKEIWSRFAAERGGVHRVPAGWFTRERERIEVVMHGVWLVLETYSTGSGKNRTDYTRWAAASRYPNGPRCKVYREGFFSSIGKALGTQDVVLGADAAFDNAFMVKCDRPEVMRRLWTPPAMQHLLGWFPNGTVESDGTTIALTEVGVASDPARMQAGLDLISDLASRDCYGSNALQEVGGPGFAQTEHGPLAALDAPTRVVLQAEPVNGQLVTVARLGADPGLAPMRLELDENGRPSDPALASALPQGAQVYLRQVGAGTLSIEAGAHFSWRGIQTDPARLRAAAQLLGALSTGGAGGVFR